MINLKFLNLVDLTYKQNIFFKLCEDGQKNIFKKYRSPWIIALW